MGCGTLFSWNGRHPIAVHELTADKPLHATIDARAGRRYTIGIHAVVDRQGLVEEHGIPVVEAKLPFVASINDSAGTQVVRSAGWLDPHEPPTVLYGNGHNVDKQHAPGEPPPELVIERLVGPWPSAQNQPISFDATLGEDRVQKVRIASGRVVVYDDAYPTSIKVAFSVAATGAVICAVGVMLLLLRGVRSLLSRRGGNRRRKNV